MEDDRPEKRPGEDQLASPAKRTSAPTVDASLMRQLLAEQSAMMLTAQQRQLEMALEKQDQRYNEKFQKMDDRMDESDKRYARLEEKVTAITKEMAEGSGARSTEAPTAGGGSALDKYRYSLIFRGWARDTRRATILRDVKEAIGKVGVRDFCDGDPWVSGARRSNAFLNFHARGSEMGHQIRDRMQKIIVKFGEAQPEVRGTRVTATWSKPPEERARGSHCNFTKKVVASLAESALENLDMERQTGSAWLGDTKSSSAVEKLSGDKQGFYIFEDRPNQPWVHVDAIAKELRIGKQEVWDMVHRFVR